MEKQHTSKSLNDLLEVGDYVLATKWHDGDPRDQWAIGFYSGILPKSSGERHLVVDDGEQQFRANGFRRVKKISAERGRWILERRHDIEQGTRSLWWWARACMTSTAIAKAKGE